MTVACSGSSLHTGRSRLSPAGEALGKLPGVADTKIDLGKKTVTVTFDPDKPNLAALVKGHDRCGISFFGATVHAICSLGHGLHEASPGDADATRNCVFSTEKAAAGNADCGMPALPSRRIL